MRVVATPFDSFQLIGFSADGAFLITGGGAGGTMPFDAVTGAAAARLAGHRDGVTTAAIRDGLLLSGDFGGEVRLRLLFLDPAPLITEAAEITARLAPLSPAARCRFFLDPAEDCAGAVEK